MTAPNWPPIPRKLMASVLLHSAKVKPLPAPPHQTQAPATSLILLMGVAVVPGVIIGMCAQLASALAMLMWIALMWIGHRAVVRNEANTVMFRI